MTTKRHYYAVCSPYGNRVSIINGDNYPIIYAFDSAKQRDNQTKTWNRWYPNNPHYEPLTVSELRYLISHNRLVADDIRHVYPDGSMSCHGQLYIPGQW